MTCTYTYAQYQRDMVIGTIMLIVAMSIGAYYARDKVTQGGVPPAPEAIPVAIPDINRTHTLILERGVVLRTRREFPKVFAYVPLRELPKDAICVQSRSIFQRDDVVTLVCTWVHGVVQHFARYVIPVPTPAHVKYWVLDRHSLQLVPVLKSTWEYHLGWTLAFWALACAAVFTFALFVLMIYLYWDERDTDA